MHKTSKIVERLIVGLACLNLLVILVAALVLGDWRRHVLENTLLVGLFLLASIVLAWRMHRSWRQEHAAAEKLRESNEKYKRLVETTGTGYVILDEQGRVADANPEYVRLTGRQRLEEILGHSVLEWTAARDHERNGREVGKCLERGFIRNLEIDYLTPAGQVIPIEINATVLRAGGAVQILTLCRDITERKRAEQELARLNQHHELILGSAAEGILGLDMQGNHTFVNPAAARMLGYEAGELLGRRSHGTWHHTRADGSPYPDRECQIYAAYRDGAVHRSSTEIFWRKDGTSFPVEYASTPIYDNGLLTGAVVTFADITERKRLEAQLLQAQKLEAIGQLAGGVAHDFRNQLAVIAGCGERLLRNVLIAEGHEHLAEEILRAADRGTQLTGQLLAFSRKDMLQPSLVHLDKVVAELAGPMSRLVGEDIVVSTAGNGPDCVVNIAVTQFGHALMNLAANARDAMPRGGELTLDTACIRVDEPLAATLPDARVGPYVRVIVRDNGIGMDPATQARLFEPFFTTKTRGKGTGLGLPMVYGFVRQSGGFITVESAPDKGTAFALHFPRVSATVAPNAGRIREPDAREDTDALRGTETILVVEDEPLIRWLLAQGLRESGYTLIESGDARQAMEAVDQAQARIDLLITDVVMPGMSGVELAAHLRGRWPDIPVLFVSGYSDDELSQRGVDLSSAELLVKPFGQTHLIKTVRRILESTVLQK